MPPSKSFLNIISNNCLHKPGLASSEDELSLCKIVLQWTHIWFSCRPKTFCAKVCSRFFNSCMKLTFKKYLWFSAIYWRSKAVVIFPLSERNHCFPNKLAPPAVKMMSEIIYTTRKLMRSFSCWVPLTGIEPCNVNKSSGQELCLGPHHWRVLESRNNTNY